MVYNHSWIHYNDVIMGAIASPITNLTLVYSTVYSDADQRKHQSSASLAFVRGIHRGPGNSPQSPVNSPHKWPVTRKMFPLDDVIMSMVICTNRRWRNAMDKWLRTQKTADAIIHPCQNHNATLANLLVKGTKWYADFIEYFLAWYLL